MNPGLREREAKQAQIREQIRLQTKIDRGDTTFGEKVAYFIDDHKSALIGFGIIAGLFGVLVIGTSILVSNGSNRSAATAPSPSPTKSMTQQRIDYAKNYSAKNLMKMTDLRVSTDGADSDTLVIVSKSIDDKFVQPFRAGATRRRIAAIRI